MALEELDTPVAVVAGSGIDLMPLLDSVAWERPFGDFTSLSASSVPGHQSRFVKGGMLSPRGSTVPIILQCGRRHVYEGCTFDEIVRTVDVLHELGARSIIFTNAAGAINPLLKVGNIVANDRLIAWPFQGFPLPESLAPEVVLANSDSHGTYAFMHGPCYETPAEIAALRALKADVVGMSTLPELCRCQQLGIPAAALSVVTNLCGAVHVHHSDVVSEAKLASLRIQALLRNALMNR